MNPKIQAALLVILMLGVGYSESVGAWHAQPEVELPEELPGPPDEPPVETEVIPVDQALDEAFDTIGDVNDTAQFTYRIIGDTLNAVDDELDRTAKLPLTLFRDGAGGPEPEDPHDARVGGYGDSRVVGTDGWTHGPHAAFRGQEGYTTATEPGGLYAGHARSLLVTPEIDLRTNFFHEPKILQSDDTPSVASTVYSGAYWGCDVSLSTASGVVDIAVILATQGGGGPGLYSSTLAPFCLPYREMFEQQETYATLDFWARYNLASGTDGVSIMVFTERPHSLEDAAQCRAQTEPGMDDSVVGLLEPAACRIVLPYSQAYQRDVDLLPQNIGYSGSSNGWFQDAIDLTPWMERNVWVGFYFASDRILTPEYFNNENRFDVHADYRGFHLDDLKVEAPAAPVNLGVRQLTEPSFRPGSPGEYDRATLDPDGPIPIQAHVTNLGAREVEAMATVRVLHESNRSLAAQTTSDSFTLPPGADLEVSGTFTGLERGGYIAQVCVIRAESGPTGGDLEYCDRILTEDPGTCSEDPLEANPCNQVREIFFDLIPVQSIVLGDLQRDRNQIQFGDVMTFAMPMTNLGNAPETLTITARPVSVSPPHDQHPELLPPDQRQPQTVTLEAGETKTIEWDIEGTTQGQFRLLVQVNSTTAKPLAFAPEYDLRPSAVQPWQSFAKSPGVGFDDVDGRLTDEVWMLAPRHDPGLDNARVQVANDDNHLWIGIRNVSAPSLTLFFNDMDDEDITSGGGGRGVDIRASSATGLRYEVHGKSWVSSGPFEGRTARTPYLDEFGDPVPDKFTYEIEIPLRSDGPPAGEPSGPPPVPPHLEWNPPRALYFEGEPLGPWSMNSSSPTSSPSSMMLHTLDNLPDPVPSHWSVMTPDWVYEPGHLDINGRDIALEWYGISANVLANPTWDITLWVDDGDGVWTRSTSSSWNCEVEEPCPNPDVVFHRSSIQVDAEPGIDANRYGFTIENAVATNPDGMVGITLRPRSSHDQAPLLLYGSEDHPTHIEIGTAPLMAGHTGPYAGSVDTPVPIVGGSSGGVRPVDCQWSTTVDDAIFADAGACATTVTFSSEGAKDLTLIVDDGENMDLAQTTVTIGSGTREGFFDAGPGDAVGMFLRLCTITGPGFPCEQYPADAPLHDGDGIHPPDGDLGNELRQWHSIRLTDPLQFGDDGSGFAENTLSSAFAVGAMAPPLMLENFEDCSSLQGWIYSPSPLEEFMGMRDKWNCGHYPDDDRVLLYKGLSPDSDCGDVACLPYVGLGEGSRPAGSDGVDRTELMSPPFEVPADVADPTMVLSHQFSSSIDIEDLPVHAEWNPPGSDVKFHHSDARLRISHTMNAHLEQWMPGQGWVNRGLLEPVGGYSSEESVGIRDDRFPPREYYSHPDCGTDNSIGHNAQWVARCPFQDHATSWWWPQGEQPLYRPLDTHIPKGGKFTGGSPWITDYFSLGKVQTEDGLLDIRGGTYRFRFSFTTWDSAAEPGPGLDWGWRIGGVAVFDEGRFVRDIAVRSAEIEVPYDPEEVGLGPGTSVPVRVTVANEGLADVQGVRVGLVGEDIRGGGGARPVLCQSEAEIPGALVAGQVRNVTLECGPLPEDQGSIVTLRASAHLPGDGFHGNNHQRVRGQFPINSAPDAIVSLDASPRLAGTDTARDIQIQLQNIGNTPLTGANVTLRTLRVDEVHGPQLQSQQTWNLVEPLSFGEPVSLRDYADSTDPPIDPPEDLRFQPPRSGSYILEVLLDVPGAQLTEDRATVRLEAFEEIYRNSFDGPPTMDPDVVTGVMDLESEVWTIQQHQGPDGSAHILAGDPARAEIPVGSDATVLLPEIDLGAVRSATLSFNHRYDLEEGFDAARVEMSVDGGDSWHPLVPRSQPLNDLPEGYPSIPLIGTNAILREEIDCVACAYTGRSEDLPGHHDGWVTAEFDLTRQPHFWQDAALDEFSLAGFHPHAMDLPVGTASDTRFLHDTWILDEPGAEQNERHWWISNQTYNEPQPLSANRMWWSGTAGATDTPGGFNVPVDTNLTFQISGETLQSGSLGGDERTIFTFWDWRAGWQDSRDKERKGTGGAFRVSVHGEGFETEDPPVRIVERLPSGWTKREVDITHIADRGDIELRFNYVSGPVERGLWNLNFDCLVSSCEEDIWMSEIQSNRGWFIDQAELIKKAETGDETLYRNDADHSENIEIHTGSSGDPRVRWSSVPRGTAHTDGGWHVAPAEVPRLGTVDAWRFGLEGAEGYPGNADSRLVTPVVDLREYGGDHATFRFDHRYNLLGDLKIARTGGPWNDPIIEPVEDPDKVPRAIDAGWVVYQVFDEATGTYGPWKTLGAEQEPKEFAFTIGHTTSDENRWLISEPGASGQDFTSMGYTAVAPMPFPPTGNVVQIDDVRLYSLAGKTLGSKVGEGNTDHQIPYGDIGISQWRVSWVDMNGNGVLDDDDHVYLRFSISRDVVRIGDLRLTPVTIDGHTYPAGSRVQDGEEGFVGTPSASNPPNHYQEYQGEGLEPEDVLQWVDVDGDGEWSRNDLVYINTSALQGESESVNDRPDLGDIRITPVGGHPFGSRVAPGDDDLAFTFAGPPKLVSCFVPGNPSSVSFGQEFIGFYLTQQDSCGDPVYNARSTSAVGFPGNRNQGIGFPAYDTATGWFRPGQGSLSSGSDRHTQLLPLEEFPFSRVFSGDSTLVHPDSDGWKQVEWDISHLIGKQARFGFHAWTNPSEAPCPLGNAIQYFGSGFSGERGHICDRPMDGWTVANIGVEGQRFQGEPVQIRFRVATDESMPKGEWRIDDVLIVGQRYHQAIGITVDEPYILEEPGTEVNFSGEIRNLGSSPRAGLALGIDVRNMETGNPVDWAFTDTSLEPIDDSESLPPGFSKAHGPFDLMPSGGKDSILPVNLTLVIPAGQVEVRLQVLEDRGNCTEIEGEDVCTTAYRPVANEEGAGLAVARWIAEGKFLEDFQIISPVEGRRDAIVAEPLLPSVGETIGFKTNLLNNGTVAPETLDVHWKVQRIERKGNPEEQKHTQEIIAETIELGTKTITPPDRGQSLTISEDFSSEEEGLYRIVVEIRGESRLMQEDRLELMIGSVESYYGVDFSTSSPSEEGWKDTSPPQGSPQGGSPPDIRFRHADDRLIWGVTQEDFLNGTSYCHAGGCNPPVDTHGGTEGEKRARDQPVYGLQGIASGPFVDLGRVVGDRAILTLHQGHGFEERDGAVIEVLPVRHPINPLSGPNPVFMCEGPDGARPMWFRPDPGAFPGIEEGYPAQRIQTGMTTSPPPRNSPMPVTEWVPARESPVGTTAIGGAPVDSQSLRFFLDKPPKPVCPPGTEVPADFDENPLGSLVNYTVQLRLRTGTVPGVDNQHCTSFGDTGCPGSPRTGSMGWQIRSIGISSVEVGLEPKDRVLPILDGYPKTFNMRVTNLGSIPDAFEIGLHAEEGALLNTSWIGFPVPTAFLAPGESRIIPFEVHVPSTDPRPQRGHYVGDIQVKSTTDPTVVEEVRFVLDLREHLLPDLAVQFSIETEGADPEPGKPTHVIATVHNLGRIHSEPVPIEVGVVRKTTGERLELGSATVPSLCPVRVCDDDRTSTHIPFDWVPDSPGEYLIEAIVDPEGRLIQESLANSRATALVEVVPLQRPDVAVVDLVLEGVSEDGYAMAGDLVTVKANITNLGAVPASQVEVRILSGTGELLETTIPAIQPGQIHTITASRLVSEGETTIRVIITPTGDDLRIDNNELRKILRVRGVDLGIQGPLDALGLAPGESGAARINVTNQGNAVERVLLRLHPDHEGWSMAGTPNPLTVAPESTAWSIITLRAPPDAKAGTHEIRIQGSPQSQPQGIVTANVTVAVSTERDTPLTSIGNLSASPGPAELPVHLESRSNTDEKLHMVLVAPEWETAPLDVTLPASRSLNVSLPLEIPPMTPPGEVPILIQILGEDKDVLGESAGTINVTMKPGGSAEWTGQIASPRSDIETRLFQFSMNVTNTGNVPFVPDIAVVNLTEGARAVEPDERPATIFPGDISVIPVQIETASEFAGRIRGEVEIYMRENPTDAFLDERRPIARMTIPTLGALPDLTIPEVTIRPRGEIPAHEPVQISLKVHNAGLASAPESKLYGYVNGELINAWPVEALQAGATTTLNLTTVFPTADEFLIHFVADGPGEILELHEDNNGWIGVIKVDSGGLTDRIRETPGPIGPLMALLAFAAAVMGMKRKRE